MAGKKALHMVHGEWMTVYEAAARLGVAYATLMNWRWQHRRPGGGPGLLEDAWDHYAALNAGWIRRGPYKRPTIHMVHGRRMTVREAAEALGVSYKAVCQYRYKYGATLQRAWDFYAARNAERAAAERLGVKLKTLQWYRRYHRCGLAEAVAHYEAKRQKRAEKEILEIIMNG